MPRTAATTRAAATARTAASARTACAVVQNLILQSQSFDNASWVKVNASISADAVTAPDGTLTADTITDTVTNGKHDVQQTWTTTPSGWTRTFTFSCYVKAGTSSWVNLNNSDVSGLTAYFNVSTGVVGTVGGTISSATITSVGNGWYRCAIVFTSSGTASAIIVHVNMASADGTDSYAGGTGTLQFWGAQFELCNFVGEYVVTTAAAVNTGNRRNKAL